MDDHSIVAGYSQGANFHSKSLPLVDCSSAAQSSSKQLGDSDLMLRWLSISILPTWIRFILLDFLKNAGILIVVYQLENR